MPGTDLFCWGNTANGELGLGGIEDQHILSPIELKLGLADVLQVQYVACGKFHSILLSQNGGVFACGSNDYGQLGHSKSRTRFEKVDALGDYVMKKLACGESHSMATNEWGEIFSWGADTHGQLGQNSNVEGMVKKPKIIKTLATCVIVQITCGSNHSLALTNSGDLFSWGCNDCGQLGVGHKNDLHSPTVVKSLSGIPLAFIASGGNHSFAVSKSGAVFGWGKNNFGQLGLNCEQDQVFPCNLRTLRSIKVKHIACGEDFSVFLTQDGGVFTCGAGQYGQLGHGSTSNEILPRKVLELMGSIVTQICCGRRHTLALVPSRGRVYSFGLGGKGQLGTRAVLSSSTPQVVLGPWLSPSGVPVVNTDNKKVDYVIKRIFSGGDHCFASVTHQKDKVSPDDCREFAYDSQILSISLNRMLECQRLQPGSNIPDDLLTYLETVMGSLSCINGSFLLPDNKHFCCTSRHHGVDIAQAQACFDAIARIEHPSVIDVISDYLMGKVIPKLTSSPPDVESLRVYLILPLYHQFDNAKNSFRLQKPFGSAILSLKPEAARVVGLWYIRMSTDYFERLIRVYQNVLLSCLKPPQNADPLNINWSTDMDVSLDVLDILNKLNYGEHYSGLKVPYNTFYVPEISERVDIRVDYVRWVLEKPRQSKHASKRYFCNYPFLFDAEAKMSLLQTDQSMQMQSAMNEAASQAFTQILFAPVISSTVSQFLELHVSRENIVQDTLREMSGHSEKDYKKPLKVYFLGEEAEDAGGVKKEFFMLLLKEILDPKYGMFRSYEETNTIWFSEDSFEDEIMYYLIGLLCGLAIYNFTIISLPFPLALYKKLLGEVITLQDLKDLSPTLTKSLQDLLDYEQPDVQDVFCLNFEVTREVFGEVKTYELKPGGSKIPVTLENKKEFVDLFVDFTLNTSVARHYRAFHDAFHKVCGGYVLKLFHAQELMAVVIGNENYDWDALESNASYRGGYTSSDPTIRMFWEVFHELPLSEKKKFLLFLTGSDRIPIQGMKAIKITIQPTNDAGYLPVAHTCFNLLDLPRYGTKERLKYKMLQAIQQTMGFSLV